MALGFVETPAYQRFMSAEEAREVLDGLNAFQPLGRHGQPDDVAEAIVFLAGAEAELDHRDDAADRRRRAGRPVAGGAPGGRGGRVGGQPNAGCSARSSQVPPGTSGSPMQALPGLAVDEQVVRWPRPGRATARRPGPATRSSSPVEIR